MKKAFYVFVNFISFGIPLLLRVLSKSSKFTQILNHQVRVTVDVKAGLVRIVFKDTAITLEIDSYALSPEIRDEGRPLDV